MSESPEHSAGEPRLFVFPRWVNTIRPGLTAILVGAPIYAVLVLAYGASPRTTNVGYSPQQPLPFDHSKHAGELGVDCRYCHTTVEVAARAAIPPTQTCMNCHANVRRESDNLVPVRQGHATGMPIEWVRVHDLPDYVYFNHSAHVSRGIGCKSCHGRVDKMAVVFQVETLSMGWCLDCHRDPRQHLRPRQWVTRMDWRLAPDEQLEQGKQLRDEYNINPSTDCSTCHR